MFGFRSVTLPTTTFASVVFGLTLFFLTSFRAGAVPPDPSLYFPGQLLVKLKPAPPGLAPQAVPPLAGARIKATLPILGWQLVQLPAGMAVPAAIEYYRDLPNV